MGFESPLHRYAVPLPIGGGEETTAPLKPFFGERRLTSACNLTVGRDAEGR